MYSGLDRLFTEKPIDLKDRQVGLLCHPSSVDAKLRHAIDLFRDASGVSLVRLFGPEHGVWGTAQDMEEVGEMTDPLSGLPVTSLYGSTFETLAPRPNDLKGIDVLVCDLQDIGSRYYTFIYTMALCLKACAALKKEVIVLDRPNPINGTHVEGPLLKKGFESFVGLYPGLPIRHGMTIGELAQYLNEEFRFECKLQVVKMEGWSRAAHFEETGLPWVLPSPNMPSVDAALVYPGMCLIEATELSEGRGTTRPFELVGAPFIDPRLFAEELTKHALPGIAFRPTFFKPTFQKWAHQDCGGVQLHITDRQSFRPFLTGVAVLKAVIDLYPNEFSWRTKPYEFVDKIPAIDLLYGCDQLRIDLEQHRTLEQIRADWPKQERDFEEKRKKYLLY